MPRTNRDDALSREIARHEASLLPRRHPRPRVSLHLSGGATAAALEPAGPMITAAFACLETAIRVETARQAGAANAIVA